MLIGLAPAHIRGDFRTYRLAQKSAQIGHIVFTTTR